MRPRTQCITPRYDYLLATCLNDAGKCNAFWKNILKNPLQNKWPCLYKQAPSYRSASKYQHKLHNTKSSELSCILKSTAMTEDVDVELRHVSHAGLNLSKMCFLCPCDINSIITGCVLRLRGCRWTSPPLCYNKLRSTSVYVWNVFSKGTSESSINRGTADL